MRAAVEQTHVGYFEVGDMVPGLGWEQYPYPVSRERVLAGNSNTIALQPNPATHVALLCRRAHRNHLPSARTSISVSPSR
ncbi:hypothetical protein MARA_35970 [Mycolicibacterium arabiense]|uniref:Uncharacterized protein n=1 Tax=Mycolicibacterium arabiense TaxID=1286181 RepID=A0A7I7S1M9_9MYCO|nr:hypothetical protein MARA_35970 [Mycolicibacterium arabiense]